MLAADETAFTAIHPRLVCGHEESLESEEEDRTRCAEPTITFGFRLGLSAEVKGRLGGDGSRLPARRGTKAKTAG